MKKLTVAAGIILCMGGIALIHQNRWLVGLILFVGGFLLMMYTRGRG